MYKIDHIVYSVLDLEEGIRHVSETLGCPVTKGGHHMDQGTHNALLNLGDGSYLEIIATDPANHKVGRKHWMGLDHLEENRTTRYALKSENIEEDVRKLKPLKGNLSTIFDGSRKRPDGTTLSWRMSLPHHSPLVEELPFLVEWKGEVHPTQTLANLVQLQELRVYTKYWHTDLANNFPSEKLTVIQDPIPRIEMDIMTSQGLVTL